MQNANPTWGAPRIHGELLKLGIEVAQATVSKYLPRSVSHCMTSGMLAIGRLKPESVKPGVKNEEESPGTGT